ncbi:MAG: hypothetical protein C0597_15050, partial [Marinilabiliales bacterium]
NEISENLNTKIEVESVNFRFFNKVVLINVYVEDQLQDTLMYSKEIICSLSKLDRKEKIIDIKAINLQEAKIYLNKFDSLQPINLIFSKDSMSYNDSASQNKKKWEVLFKNIEMHNSVFWYKSFRKKERPNGVINFNDLICYIEDLDVRDLKIENGVVNFYTKKLKFKEKTGFYAYNVKFLMSIGKEHMIFKNVKIRTPYSYINSDSVVFRHNNYDEYQQFAKNIYLDFAFQESNVSFNDIAYYSSIFKDIPINIVLSGRVYSKLSSFKGKDLSFQIGEQTELITDFSLNGLPDYNEMFMYIDFKKLTTYAKDFEIINKFLKNNKKISIPESFDKLGIINYKGNFAGFYDDFVTYGKFTSDLGDVSTDISLRPDISQSLAFSGNLVTNDFNVGELFPGTERIGRISADANIKGSLNTKKEVDATTKGVIHNIEINDYNYQNIQIDGFLTENTYDGFLSIADPNIELDFQGGIDFSKEIPSFNFVASVPSTNLYGLNIDKKDSTSQLSFEISAKFEGVNIDDIVGEVNFNKASIRKLNTELIFDTLKLVSYQQADTQKIELISDYINALLVGNYKPSTLAQSIKNLYFNYLPDLVKNTADTVQLEFNNSFNLHLELKETNILSRFFIPSVYCADNSTLHLSFDDHLKSFQLNAHSNEFKFKNHTFIDITSNTFSNDSIFTIFTKCSSFLLNNYFELENFKTTTLTHRNNIDLKIDWNNNDTTDYEGKILASTFIKQKEPYGNPSFTFTILPSQVVVNDSLWFISKSQVKLDTTSLYFNNFKINHGLQNFVINGKVSENPNDTLFFEFDNLNLSHLNLITKEKKLVFEGIINGKANFSSIFDNPLFYSDIKIDNLVLNDEAFGFTQIYSRWIESAQAIQLEASTLINDKRAINISGNYYPVDKNIMFNIVLDKLGLNVLNPYLKSFASDISGQSDGTVLVTGNLNKPVFNGSLFMQDAAMNIDYIKTRYNFTTEVVVNQNKLEFNSVSALDTYGNQGITNGFVKFGPNKNISFDFNINTDKILALNTTSNDNETFFGTAFVSGVVNITGNRENTFLDISAKTERDTKVSIPLTRFQNSDQDNFITFTNNNNETATVIQPEFSNDYSGFNLNFDIEITPDAEALLIFDSKIGDIIRGNGEGNLTMEMDGNNDFKMYGDFNIEEGDYLFTLQNVINKKFKIKKGGTILWNGEPADANIDLQAVYTLRTSLNNLVDSSSTYYSNEDYKKRIPVECQVFLTNRLTNPDIAFDLNLPTADEESKTLLKTAINTEEKLNKQFLSLLVLNSFLPEQSGTESSFNTSTSTAGLGTVTTSELLSNQLSHWLSQISDEWDIGVNYRPGDEISKDEVEVALSTQIFDDRVSINGNVGYGGQTVDQASNIVGDFNLEVKLNQSGKLRLRAFNESNDKLLYEDSPYTQGVGIFYREEFSSFSELMNKFWNRFRRKKEDDKSE